MPDRPKEVKNKKSIATKLNEIFFGENKINILTDSVIEKVIDDMVGVYNTRYDYTLTDLLSKSVLAKDGKTGKENISEKVEELIDKHISRTPTMFDSEHMARLVRYRSYDAVERNITKAQLALKVYISNIKSPDYVSKKSLNVIFPDAFSDKLRNKYNNRIEQIMKNVLDLEKHVDQLIKQTLKYGDSYFELIDIDKRIQRQRKTLMLSKTAEDYEQSLVNDRIYDSIDKHNFTFSIGEAEEEKIDVNVKVKYENTGSILEAINSDEVEAMLENESRVDEILADTEKEYKHMEKNNPENNIEININRYKGSMLNPRRVIKLGDDTVRFGYLVFPNNEDVLNNFIEEGGGQFDIRKLNTTTLSGVKQNKGLSEGIVSALSRDILDGLKDKLGSIIEKHNYDIMSILSDLFQYVIDYRNVDVYNIEIPIRFIPEEYIQEIPNEVDKFAPYGTSIFDGILLPAKLYLSAMTAIAIDRAAHARETRIWWIDVDFTVEAQEYIQEFKKKLRLSRFKVDESTNLDGIPSTISSFENIYGPMRDGKKYFEVDKIEPHDIAAQVEDAKLLRNELVSGLKVPPPYLSIEENIESKCLALDTKIPLIDGRVLTLKDIIEEHKDGKVNYTYSYNNDTGKIFANKIINAEITRRNAEVIKVTLDNDKFIICTPDHKFMLRDGTYVYAKDLTEGVSLMPLYLKYSSIYDNIEGEKGGKNTYQMVYNPGNNSWEYTHRQVSLDYSLKEKGKVCHHNDFNRYNNNPENLNHSMKWSEHRKYHQDNAINGINSPENIKKRVMDPKWKQAMVEAGKKGGAKSGKKLAAWVKEHGPYNKGKTKKLNPELYTNKHFDKKPKDVKCPICGVIHKVDYPYYKLCSIKCKKEYKKRTGIKLYKYNLKRGILHEPISMKCTVCGKEYISDYYKANLAFNKYNGINSCSSKGCTKIVKSMRIYIGRTNKLLKNRPFAIDIWYDNCSICGNMFIRSDYKEEIKNIKLPECCSQKCRNKVLSDRRWSKVGKKQNHKVKSIESLNGKIDTGDIQVEKYNNFALDSGVIVHNSTLSYENVIFATLILDYQKNFSEHLTSCLAKAYKLVFNENLPKGIEIAFNPPLLLLAQTQVDHLSNFSSVYEFLKTELGIDKGKIINKFLPYLKEFFNDDSKLEMDVDTITNSVKSGENENEEEI